MAGLDAFAQLGLLDFNKVSHVGFFADLAAWAQMSEGTDLGFVGNCAFGQHAALANQHAVTQGAVIYHRKGRMRHPEPMRVRPSNCTNGSMTVSGATATPSSMTQVSGRWMVTP